MYVLASNNWFQDLIRTFFFSIDKIVFNFISTIYDLLISIARTSVLSQADIADMADRIYNLLAVFMIFKVTFSLIMYVVNPDDFSDKSKGISKLGINIVFSLAMLVLTPYIFNYAYQFQTIILEDNSLATLIFGKDVANSSDNPINDAGDIISYATITPFLTPNLSLDIGECSNLIVKDNNGVKTFNEGCSGLTFDGSNFATLSNGTDGTLYNLTIDNDNFSETTLKNYIVGVTNSNLALTFRQDLVLAADSNKENYIMDYKYIFSTAVGVVVVLLLISFCMDIGLRSIKLAFFQLIAPIPILSYIDPKSGKDGMFKKWYQMCLKTYLSLFLKLLALYFAIYIISRVDNMVDIVDGSYVSSMWIKIFIIIGALMFAKNFTKILEGLGVKLDGGFQLNPLRKLEKEAIGGGLLKKPNDTLGRIGKGIVTSPLNGVSLLGKKGISAIDSARHGKGLKLGWDRVHGNLHNSFYKKLDEWAPDSAEARKNERLGAEEVRQMNTKWTKGKQKADNLAEYAKKNKIPFSKPFDLLDGKNIDAYRSVYSNEEFIKSRMSLDVADGKNKILKRIGEQTMRGISLEDAVRGELKEINKLFDNPIDGQKFVDKLLIKDANGTVDTALSMQAYTKMADDTSKQVSGMEKVHESIRKQNPNDAATEDQLKFVKYNNIDPTDTQRRADENWENSTSSSQSNNQQTTTEINSDIKELKRNIEINEEKIIEYKQIKSSDDIYAEYIKQKIKELEEEVQNDKNKLSNLENNK